MSDIDKIRDDYEKAEQALYKLDAEYQDKRAKLSDRYRPRLDKLGDKAATLQKQLCDAEAAQALVGREDAAVIADNLGLTLPSE